MRNVPCVSVFVAIFLVSGVSSGGPAWFSDYQTFTVTPTPTVPYNNMIQFDLNALDFNDDQYNKPYQATLLAMVLEFRSPAQYVMREETTGYRVIRGPWWALGQMFYERDHYTIYEDPVKDTVKVGFPYDDGRWATFTRTVSAYHERDVLGDRTKDGTSIIDGEFGWTVIHHRFTQEHTTHKGWYGDVEVAVLIMPEHPSLFNDGVLNVYYDWTVGQGILIDAGILASIEPNPLPPGPSVPVPSAILLSCSGLACLRLAVRRKWL